jgi:hypothetical protein
MLAHCHLELYYAQKTTLRLRKSASTHPARRESTAGSRARDDCVLGGEGGHYGTLVDVALFHY